ncbi:Uncharacterised protein [uncultured archaeon]|nr:Uncharacterised protein [uncultured archaeon]
MKSNWLVCIAVGLALGIVIGAEAVGVGHDSYCPHPACVDKAEVTPVFDREYADKAFPEIKGAKESIHAVLFELKYYPTQQNSSVNRLVDAIVAAKKRGAEVKIVVDE